MISKQDKIFLSILIAVIFITYANSFGNELMWDSYFEVINNKHVQNFEVTNFFTKNLFAGAGEKESFYRPMVLLSYAIDYKIWGLEPFGYHLTNILLHILTIGVLYIFFLMLQSSRPVSFLASLLLAVHPFNLETVTYISGRNEALSSLFFLVSLALLTKYLLSEQKRHVYYCLSLISFVLAVLSKESAIIYPVLMVLVYFSFIKKEGEDPVQALLKIAYFFIISAAYLLLRLSVLNFGIEFTESNADLVTRVASFLGTLPTYFKIIFLPVEPHFHLVQELAFNSGEIILSGLFVFILGCLSVYYLRQGSWLLFFALVWFLLALLPVSGILFSVKYVIGERWLRLASLGIFFAISYGMSMFFKMEKSKAVNHLLIILLLSYISWLAITTIKANVLWKDQITYFEYLLKLYPDDAETHTNLGVAYDEKGMKEEAFLEYQKAVELKPDVFNIHANLGAYYIEKNEPDKATQEYRKAIVLNPNFTYGYQALAQIYAGRGNYDKAIKILKRLTEILPNSWKSHSLLGDAYLMKKDRVKAVESYKKGLEVEPDNENLKGKLEKLGAI